MYISYAIAGLTICTAIILRIELPKSDFIFLMRLLLTVLSGYVLYIPVISMLIDIFICNQEVKG